MKHNRLLAAIVVGCLVLLQAGCQEQARDADKLEPVPAPKVVTPPPPEMPPVPEGRPERPGPQISFETLVHDFGQIGPRTKNKCEFKFKNAGKGVLKISQVTKTCGCTASALPKKEYAPGQSGVLTVTYSAPGFPGATSKRLYVKSNDKKNSNVALTVKGEVVLKVRHKPEKLNLALKDDPSGVPKITLHSVDGKPFAIKSFNVPRNALTVSYDPSVEKTKFVLVPKIDTEQLSKTPRGYVRIGLTHPQCDTVNIPFYVLQRFKVTPPSIIIRDADPNKPIRRDVWVLNNYGEEFEVESASSRQGIIKILDREKIDNRYKFVLEITPPAPKGKTIFTDVFQVKISGGKQLQVQCRGFYPRKVRTARR
ncbi:MAG: DUF1573 domain-containing protein [Planctomycetota bacterium]